MELDLQQVVGLTAAITSAVALLIGFLSERSPIGALMLAVSTALAGGLCWAGSALGGTKGLFIAFLLVTLLAYMIGKGLGKERGSRFVPALWLGFCGSWVIGYQAGREIGLLTITLPSILVFWIAMFGVSRHLIPLNKRNQWGKAFRCLFSYCLGTNRPFHVLDDRELAQRVPGNPYGQFFSGPGIVLTDPAHAPIIWDGLSFKRIGDPGLTLTERFETVYQTVDLRPQLRSVNVEAITQDGIRVRIQANIPFQLNTNGRAPELPGSFPVDSASTYGAVWQQPVEESKRHAWEEMVPIMATRLLRRIIARYRFDELCEPLNPAKDPRLEITKRLVDRLRRDLRDCGIEILDGWLGNLEPVDSSIIEQRINAWRVEWERQILITQGQARANAIMAMEQAYVQAHAELLGAIRHIVERQPTMNQEVLTNLVALRFIEALEEMACSPGVKESAPAEAAETIEYLRRSMGIDGALDSPSRL